MKSNDVAKANEEETKTFPTNFNKKPHKNIKFLYFTSILINS